VHKDIVLDESLARENHIYLTLGGIGITAKSQRCMWQEK